MKVFVLWCVLLLPNAASKSQRVVENAKADHQETDFYLRDFTRLAGNIGGWWGLLSENEKGAFLTGYQTAMKQSYSQSRTLCKVVKDRVRPSSDERGFSDQIVTIVGICEAANEFDGFDKITTKNLDSFYSDRLNQAILIEWSMVYLRDELTGRKTKGQLLDTLEAERKDLSDCNNYPHICKLGAGAPQLHE